MIQWFNRFPELSEFTEFKESSATVRKKNSIVFYFGRPSPCPSPSPVQYVWPISLFYLKWNCYVIAYTPLL